jgi:uncharacterized membrane protein YwaF
MSYFIRFGLSQWFGLLFSLGLLFLGFKCRNLSKKTRVLIRRILAATLFSFFIIYQIYNLFVVGSWSLQGQLPLHLTNFILAYFWGFSGGLGSILSPDIGLDFPDVGYVFFWASHAPMLFAVAMVVFDTNFTLKYRDIWIAFAFLLGYMLLIYPLNLMLGSNYGYLVSLPSSISFANLLGNNFASSPNYLLPLAILTLIAFHGVFLIYKLFFKSFKQNKI